MATALGVLEAVIHDALPGVIVKTIPGLVALSNNAAPVFALSVDPRVQPIFMTTGAVEPATGGVHGQRGRPAPS